MAVNDAYTVAKNGVLTVSAATGVLSNDYDPDGDKLTISSTSRINGHALLLAPTNGTVQMNEDGSFTYTPNLGFSGVDSFYYAADDGAASVQGQVNVTVTDGTGQEPTFATNGSAINTAAHVYTITPDLAGQHGSVYVRYPRRPQQDLRHHLRHQRRQQRQWRRRHGLRAAQ